ncbi:MAG: hypothetical protein Q8K58_10845 [Acidimicrobiales bacterium]|nr:hypothetical protein [Acidimicrobiales bacterium]
MPWCAECDRFYNPNSLQADGTCPTCGRAVGEPEKLRKFSDEPAPWHFKVLLVAVVVYLGYRLYEVVLWGLQSL